MAFLRPRPFDGTFYETVWRALQRITGGQGLIVLILLGLVIFALHSPVIRVLSRSATLPRPTPANRRAN